MRRVGKGVLSHAMPTRRAAPRTPHDRAICGDVVVARSRWTVFPLLLLWPASAFREGNSRVGTARAICACLAVEARAFAHPTASDDDCVCRVARLRLH